MDQSLSPLATWRVNAFVTVHVKCPSDPVVWFMASSFSCLQHHEVSLRNVQVFQPAYPQVSSRFTRGRSRSHLACLGRDMRNQRLPYHVMMTACCHHVSLRVLSRAVAYPVMTKIGAGAHTDSKTDEQNAHEAEQREE